MTTTSRPFAKWNPRDGFSKDVECLGFNLNFVSVWILFDFVTESNDIPGKYFVLSRQNLSTIA
jgi:hypothetical protein